MRHASNTLLRIVHVVDQRQGFQRYVVFVVVIALLARLAVFAFFWTAGEGYASGGAYAYIPPDQWNELTINLVDHHTLGYLASPNDPTVVRGPVFAFIQIPLYVVFGQNYAAWSMTLVLLDIFTCFLLMITSRRLWGNRVAICAGLFYALHLPIIYYGVKIEQFTTVLPMVVIWLYLFTLWERAYFLTWLPLALGVVTGVMILNKTVYLPVPFVCTAVLIWRNRQQIGKASHLLPAVLYLLISIGVVLPWTYRNYIITKGSFVPVQSMFWELMVQDVMYHDLDVAQGRDRPDGGLLAYWIEKENAMAVAAGMSPDPPTSGRAVYEAQREKVYAKTARKWFREDPVKILKIKGTNLWHFWVRAENWRKTKVFILMQSVHLIAATAGLLVLIRYRKLEVIKFGLLLIVILWGEHCLVWGWGRLSLDLVPVLGLLFGLGVDEWAKRYQAQTAPARAGVSQE